MKKHLLKLLFISFLTPTIGLAMEPSHAEANQHQPVSISRSSSFYVDFPVAQATSLFTAEPELIWAPGWKYIALKGDGFNVGDVFIGTGEEVKYTFVVVNFNEADGYIRFAQFLSGHSVGTTEIIVSPQGKGSSVKAVRTLTSLSHQGALELEQLTDEAFSAFTTFVASSIKKNRTELDSWLQQHHK